MGQRKTQAEHACKLNTHYFVKVYYNSFNLTYKLYKNKLKKILFDFLYKIKILKFYKNISIKDIFKLIF